MFLYNSPLVLEICQVLSTINPDKTKMLMSNPVSKNQKKAYVKVLFCTESCLFLDYCNKFQGSLENTLLL